MSTQAVITEFCERHPGAPAYKLGLCLPCFRGDATNVRETMGSFRYKKAVIKRSSPKRVRPLINPVAVIETVVGAYGVPESLMTHCNSPEFSEPRHTAMYLLRECTRLSYPAIGRLFGFHHTTVLYGVRQTQRRMKQDLEFKAAVNRLALQFKPSPKQEAMVQV